MRKRKIGKERIGKEEGWGEREEGRGRRKEG